MRRRDALHAMLGTVLAGRPPGPTVTTLIGSGAPGYGQTQVANPYGVVIGPDAGLTFCDLDNQRIRRLDLRTRRTIDLGGSGERGYAGDGGPATRAALNMPHEVVIDADGHLYVAERDNHVVRRIDGRTGLISTLAGTGAGGFSGDGGPAAGAELRQPHSVSVAGRRLLICDTGNHRVRAVDLASGRIETVGGTGERLPTPDGAILREAPLNGPRAIALAADGTFYLALREGNAIYRVDAAAGTLHHLAGTGAQGYTGDGGPARQATLGGPKGLALAGRALFVADTENHAIRRVDLDTGVITTVLGTGVRGDGPESDPRQCRLSRPHGVFADGRGTLYVGDSEAHRIRMLAPG